MCFLSYSNIDFLINIIEYELKTSPNLLTVLIFNRIIYRCNRIISDVCIILHYLLVFYGNLTMHLVQIFNKELARLAFISF